MIQLVKPCRGHITQRFGNIQSHDRRKHTGNDYAYYSQGQVMDEVFAAADGVVLYAGDSRNLGWPNGWYLNPDFDRSDNVDSSAGNVVILGHKQGDILFDTTYNHVADWSAKAGDTVRAAQRIATIGDSGFSAGKHLHFEVLFRPFNFGTETYGRADPNPYFIAGLAAQGSTSPAEPKEWDEMASEEAIDKIVRAAVKDVLFNGQFDELPGRGRKLTIPMVLGYLGADLSALFTKPFDVQNAEGRTGRTNSLAQFLTWAPSDTAGTHQALAQLAGLVVAQGEALQRIAAGEPIDYDKIGELIAEKMPTFVAVPPERTAE